MAVLFDATADMYSRTTGLPPITTFSILGWAFLAVDRNATTVLFYFGTTGGTGHAVRTATDGTTLNLFNGSATTAGAALSLSTWYHLALTVAGTGASQCIAYLNGVANITGAGNASVTAQTLRLGNDVTSQFLNGRLAAVKVYDVALGASDVQQEMTTFMPIRTANLNSWYPMIDSSTSGCGTDFSGQGRTLTVGGTLTIADGPPIAWTPHLLLWPQSAAAAPTPHYAPPPLHRSWRVWRRVA